VKEQFSVHYWGPLLFRIKIKIEYVKDIIKICDEATEKFNTSLAGIIDDEVLIDKIKYAKIIQPYLVTYNQAYELWYNQTIQKITVNSAWVNYMKKGECNPPHTHDQCHLSSVLILEVPETLKKEQKNWKGTGMGPGTLTFSIGNPNSFQTNIFSFRPEIGDLFIFPWNLTHSVSSYKSDVRRISVAANFNLEEKK
tara:strand:+ start:46 stop:633 length:588 start_codon:yes stop_codon:yes gene_type:complete